MSKWLSGRLWIAIAIFSIFLIYGTFFTVTEGEAVVVTRLGAPVREISEPGPYWKLPSPIDHVQRIDTRQRILTTPEQSTFTKDKKNIVLTTFVIWHVEDPLLFLQSVRGDGTWAEVQLVGKTSNVKNTAMGQHNLSSLLSLQRDEIKVDEIEATICNALNESSKRLGIAIDQVGIERITFPQENMPAVLENMQVDRLAEANRLRTEGEREAGAIRNKAHIESQEILRKGRDEASRILADADVKAGRMLAEAYQQDPSFYKFWLSLETSKKLLANKPTLIFRTDQAPFNVLTGKPDVDDSVADPSEYNNDLNERLSRTEPDQSKLAKVASEPSVD